MVWAHGARRHAGDDPAGQLARARAELSKNGTLDEAGIPDPDLADALYLVARAPLLLDIRYTAAGEDEVRALVGGDRITAVRGVLADGSVTLEQVDPAHPEVALLATLPDASPAPGQAIELPATVVDRGVRAAMRLGNASDAAIGDELALLELPHDTVAALLSMIGGERTLYGQIGLTMRDADGTARRAPNMVQVVDAQSGRAALWTWDGRLRAASGTFERFTDLVADLIEQVGTARRGPGDVSDFDPRVRR